jgi:hypothetical protein
VIEHVQRGLDAGARLGEVKIADREADAVGRRAVELRANFAERSCESLTRPPRL